MPVAIVLAAMLVGVLGRVELFGHDYYVSALDLACLGIFGWGVVRALQRRRVRFDLALIAYGLMGVVLVLQLIGSDERLDLLGMSTLFAFPALLLFGLSQLVDEPATLDDASPYPAVREPPAWARAFMAFGLVLAGWTIWLVARAALDPSVDEFYELKNSIVMPLGASNYVGAFLLVATAVSAGVTVRLFRFGRLFGWSLVVTIVCALGLVASLSRGAVIAAVVVAIAAAIGHRSRGAAVATIGVVGVVVVAGVIVGAVAGERLPDEVEGVIGGETAGRLVLFEAAWDAFLTDPILGVGLNEFDEVAAPVGPPHPNAHNLELNALATTGLLGTGAYVALLAILVTRIRRLRLPRSPEPGGNRWLDPYAYAVALAFGAFLLHAQVEAVSYTRAGEALIAVLIAVTSGSAISPFVVERGPRSGDAGSAINRDRN